MQETRKIIVNGKVYEECDPTDPPSEDCVQLVENGVLKRFMLPEDRSCSEAHGLARSGA